MKKESIPLNFLHVLNDGFKASLLLLLPFIAKEFAMSLTKVGFLGSAVNSLDIFLAIPAAYFASKIGGKHVLILAVFFSAVGYLLMGIAPHYSFIVLAFIVAGMAFGVFHPIGFALVAKMSDKKDRGTKLGNFTAAGDIGKAGISSLITFVIVYIGWRSTTLAMGGLLLVLSLYFVHLVKKDVIIKTKAEGEEREISYGFIVKNKKFIYSTLSYCFDSLASSSLFVFLPFLLLQRHVGYAFLGVLTSTFFIGNMFGKLFLGRLVDRFGNANVFIVSEFLMALFIILLSNAVWLPLIIASSVILGAFTKGTTPVLTAMVSESVEHHKGMEKVFGLNALFVGFAATLAPFLLGFLADRWGIVMAFNASAAFAILATVPAFIFKTVKS